MRVEGTCNLCGECCDAEADWSHYLKALGEYPSIRTDGCPNLLPADKTGRRLCKIYGTKDHWFWEEYCVNAPNSIKDPVSAVGWFRRCPHCSLEFIED